MFHVQPREHDIALDDVTLHYRRWGTGPPLYLIHGGPGGSGSYWVHGVPYLGARHTVYALDLRGHGESQRKGPYTIRRMAEDIQAFGRALGHERYDLLGHSLGALVAMRAATGNRSVRRLVLVGGFPDTTRMMLHPRGLSTKLRLAVRLAHWNLLTRMGRDPPLDELLRKLLRGARPLLHARGADAERIDRHLGASVTRPLDPVVPLQREVLRWDHRAALPDMKAPTLVVVGKQDALAGPSARTLARRIPGARLVRIPRAGHSPFFDQPERFQEAVEGFLR